MIALLLIEWEEDDYYYSSFELGNPYDWGPM